MSFLGKILPSYFVDKFQGKDIDQLQLMPHEQYLTILNGTDEEASTAVRTFITQQKRGGVIILEATIELLSDLRGQTRMLYKKERE